MSFFTPTDDPLFGIATLDIQHAEIVALTMDLDHAVRDKNEAEASRLFLKLADLLNRHFDDEERLIAERIAGEAARDHLRQHAHFHSQIRQLLDYGRMKVAQGSGVLLVLPAISGQYFEEISTQDEKLRALLDGK